MKKAIAALSLAVMMVPFIGTTAQASGWKERVACLSYHTFEERDPLDYVGCFV